MAGRIPKHYKELLTKSGHWQACLKYREKLKSQGIKPEAAKQSALNEFLPKCNTQKKPPGLPDYWTAMADSLSKKPEAVRWIINHINKNPADFPSQGLRFLLQRCRSDRNYFQVFLNEALEQIKDRELLARIREE